MWHDLDIDDLEALRRVDCEIASLLGWRDAGLRYADERDPVGEYKGVALTGRVEVVPRFCTEWGAAADLPVVRREGKVIYFTPTPLMVVALFLWQRSESYSEYDSEANSENPNLPEVEGNSASQM